MGLVKSSTFSGGIHPPENKRSSGLKIEKCPLPAQVVIPVQQHIGAPAAPIVNKGDEVKAGQVIAEPSGFVSVPAHASISGKVVAVEERPHPLGKPVMSVVIENDGNDEWVALESRSLEQALEMDPKDMVGRIRNAGIAGMGGATFPTHVKLSPPPDKPIDTLILNGVECEPFLTSDHRLMLEEPEKILHGVQLIARILKVKRIVIGIESNKPDAIKLLKRWTADLKLPFEVISLHVKYPQGAEKQLIKAVTGRFVPAGGLPMDIGCVVQNVGTAAAVYDALVEGKPLVERIVTITGDGVSQPKNLSVRIGASYQHVFEQCGGLKENAGKIIMGGPMMGMAQSSVEAPVIKGTSGLLVLNEKQSSKRREDNCISCARCVDVCPMGLLPKFLAAYVKNDRFDLTEKFNVLDCIECGSCSYVCPAHINLVHWIKFGKQQVIKSRKKAG